MQDWETLIKDRMRPCVRLAEDDPVKRNHEADRKRNRTPERREYERLRGIEKRRKAKEAKENENRAN